VSVARTAELKKVRAEAEETAKADIESKLAEQSKELQESGSEEKSIMEEMEKNMSQRSND
jgi:hypothetical protein